MPPKSGEQARAVQSVAAPRMDRAAALASRAARTVVHSRFRDQGWRAPFGESDTFPTGAFDLVHRSPAGMTGFRPTEDLNLRTHSGVQNTRPR